MDAWYACLRRNRLALAESSEPSDVLADAIIGACKDEEHTAYEAGFRTPVVERLFLGPRKLDREFSETRSAKWQQVVADTRAAILAKVVADRAAARKALP